MLMFEWILVLLLAAVILTNLRRTLPVFARACGCRYCFHAVRA
jgi:hypothetical protein